MVTEETTDSRLEDQDQYILKRFKEPGGQHEAFQQLVRTYQERIYSIVRKMVIDHDDADDVVQETFIKVWRNLEKFQGDAQLYTWLYRIATNECLRFLQKKKKRSLLSLGDANTELMEKVDQTPSLDGDEIQKRLQKALLQLPDKQRLVFNLKYFEDLKYEAIANITGTSVGGLKASYHLAVKKIEAYLQHQTI
uniref:RNA polymerase sigma factor n=1 Tax=Roseihalotalea indica TaxID=2867963 RepID=A0AA49JJJ3_9BACT|nr:sigma-70 family RNA polymerase sigma factor [Tunicatimonas sp. TK19036]